MRLTKSAVTALITLAAVRSAYAQNVPETHPTEPIVGLPCEGCEAVFDGLPDTLTSIARLAPVGEPGQTMRIEGTVYDGTGHVASGVIIYAYHTNARGIYPADERFRGRFAYRHGRLRGWAKTDAHGRYRFNTIRPASYP